MSKLTKKWKFTILALVVVLVLSVLGSAWGVEKAVSQTIPQRYIYFLPLVNFYTYTLIQNAINR